MQNANTVLHTVHVDVDICSTCMCMSTYAALGTMMIMTLIDIYLIYIIIMFEDVLFLQKKKKML